MKKTVEDLLLEAANQMALSEDAAKDWWEYRGVVNEWLGDAQNNFKSAESSATADMFLTLSEKSLKIELSFLRKAQKHRRLGDKILKKMQKLRTKMYKQAEVKR